MLPLPFLSPIWAQLTASPDAAWWVKALLWAVIWADPGQTEAGQINHNDGGRGVYFEDPDGHLLEIITRPYGSGGQRP